MVWQASKAVLHHSLQIQYVMLHIFTASSSFKQDVSVVLTAWRSPCRQEGYGYLVLATGVGSCRFLQNLCKLFRFRSLVTRCVSCKSFWGMVMTAPVARPSHFYLIVEWPRAQHKSLICITSQANQSFMLIWLLLDQVRLLRDHLCYNNCDLIMWVSKPYIPESEWISNLYVENVPTHYLIRNACNWFYIHMWITDGVWIQRDPRSRPVLVLFNCSIWWGYGMFGFVQQNFLNKELTLMEVPKELHLANLPSVFQVRLNFLTGRNLNLVALLKQCTPGFRNFFYILESRGCYFNAMLPVKN